MRKGLKMGAEKVFVRLSSLKFMQINYFKKFITAASSFSQISSKYADLRLLNPSIAESGAYCDAN